MGGLYGELKKYAESDYYPFHMPGHKRSLGAVPEVRAIDITEIEGFDNLHHAEGILKEAQERAARLYGSGETYYLVNGSTCGILSAVFACTDQRGKILMARNCHKAAYHAAQLRELETVYLYPQMTDGPFYVGGSICPQEVRKALEKDSTIQAVFITSPTYEGVISDIKTIAEIAHSFGKPLIVDEAHGAHFGFHPAFPQNSVKLGADIVIHSLHKTMPSLTQTALLHRNGVFTDSDTVRRYLSIFQTSSPSYVLMAGMDACVELIREDGDRLFGQFAKRLKEFYAGTANLKKIKILSEDGAEAAGRMFGRDCSKIIISAGDESGRWLAGVLRERYHLEPEMEAAGYVVALTSAADTDEGFARLLQALKETDDELCAKEAAGDTAETREADAKEHLPMRREAVMTIARALRCSTATAALDGSEGLVSAEYIYLYPPGVPMIVPGEKIDRELLDALERYKKEGFSLQGLKDYSGKKIDICKQAISIV